MQLAPAVRQDAARAEQTLKNCGGGFAVSGAAAALRAAVTPNVLSAAYAAVSAILSVASYATAEVKHRVAEDPPDDDYPVRTRAPRRSLKLEAVMQDAQLRAGAEALGPVGELGPELGHHLFEEGAQLGAFVRAFERAQGAKRAGASQFVQLRVREAEAFADRSVALLDQAASLAGRLSDSLPEIEALTQPFTEPIYVGGPDTTLESVLPERVLAALYRAGIRIGELRRPIRGEVVRDLIGNLPNLLSDEEGALRDLAVTLMSWEPSEDLEL